MCFKNQKKTKAVTFSYDDGITQDIRLVELLNKYNLKCTFNINSGLLAKRGGSSLIWTVKKITWGRHYEKRIIRKPF